MGPRLVSRGKKDGDWSNEPVALASMGPRLVSRGKTKPVDVKEPERRASMGPRLVSRGKWPQRVAVVVGLIGFNGAATC